MPNIMETKMKYLFLILSTIFFLGCSEKEGNDKNASNNLEEVKDLSQIKISDGNASDSGATNQFTSYNIDGERVVKLAPDGVETTTSREIGAILSIKNQYEKLSADILRKRLSQNFIVKCSACHDDYANGVIGPSLLTKTSDDIFKMLVAYKSGAKKNVLMKELIQKMPDEEIRAFADEIAKFNKEVREKK